MMYSSRELNNKVITTAATFEDKLLVLSRFMAAQTTTMSAPSRLEKQFLIANISEMLASIELKLHSMFIRFILNIFHQN